MHICSLFTFFFNCHKTGNFFNKSGYILYNIINIHFYLLHYSTFQLFELGYILLFLFYPVHYNVTFQITDCVFFLYNTVNLYCQNNIAMLLTF